MLDVFDNVMMVRYSTLLGGEGNKPIGELGSIHAKMGNTPVPEEAYLGASAASAHYDSFKDLMDFMEISFIDENTHPDDIDKIKYAEPVRKELTLEGFHREIQKVRLETVLEDKQRAQEGKTTAQENKPAVKEDTPHHR